MFCLGEVSDEDVNTLIERWNTFYKVSEYTQLSICGIGLIIVFLVYYRQKKPGFIIAIWIMITLFFMARLTKT